MTERIHRTLNYLRGLFDRSDYLRNRPADKAYRWEHSLRAARVGASIAQAEGMDQEAMTIACLLHDAYYMAQFPEGYDWKNHGRDGARLVRPFVESLGLDHQAAEDILFGIAIHVDDKADFDGRRCPFTLTVGDADNIDRFGAFRIYDNLRCKGFYHMTLKERLAWLEDLLGRLERLRSQEFATPTATELWRERVDYQLDFHRRLLEQTREGTEDGL